MLPCNWRIAFFTDSRQKSINELHIKTSIEEISQKRLIREDVNDAIVIGTREINESVIEIIIIIRTLRCRKARHFQEAKSFTLPALY